jgi:hypothetical protein
MKRVCFIANEARRFPCLTYTRRALWSPNDDEKSSSDHPGPAPAEQRHPILDRRTTDQIEQGFAPVPLPDQLLPYL